jgi:phosphatidate cytidylyltransferase
MKRVLTAAVLVPVVLLMVFRAPLWLFALAVAATAMPALHEYLNLCKGYGIQPARFRSFVVAAFVLLLAFVQPNPFDTSHALWGLILLFPLLFGVPIVFRSDLRTALTSAAASAFGVLYTVASLALLISLRDSPHYNILIVFILFTVWAGDIAAYYVGKNIGRHKLAPSVSPNKSWEGAIASVIASAAAGIVVFHFHDFIGGLFADGFVPLGTSSRFVENVIFVSICTNIAAQFGDLFESALKRGANVKDSGTILPGHGGILDRIDALLFAIPFVWYYADLFLFPPAAPNMFFK